MVYGYAFAVIEQYSIQEFFDDSYTLHHMNMHQQKCDYCQLNLFIIL